MSNETGVSRDGRYYLQRAIAEEYDVSLERADRLMNNDFTLPEDVFELSFVRSPYYSSDGPVFVLSEEFQAKAEYLGEIISYNLRNPPESKRGYISQLQIPEDKEWDVRENLNMVITGYMDEEGLEQLDEWLIGVTDELENMLENEDVSEDYASLFRTVFAFIRFGVYEGDTYINVKRAHQVFRQMFNHLGMLTEQKKRQSKRNLAKKLSNAFEDTERDEIPDYFVPYYEGNVSSLVNTIEQAFYEVEEESKV